MTTDSRLTHDAETGGVLSTENGPEFDSTQMAVHALDTSDQAVAA